MKLKIILFNRRILISRVLILVLAVAIIVSSVFAIKKLNRANKVKKQLNSLTTVTIPNWIESDIIDIHDYARTGKKLVAINNIVVHYVGNQETTAKQNRDYFNNPGTDVSSHFVVGLEGEIVQCLPLNEISAASNSRNPDTISIEVCHNDETGEFNSATYRSLIKLLAWLCRTADIDYSDIIRHYDVTGKLCPIYYVKNPQKWKELISDVKDAMK